MENKEGSERIGNTYHTMASLGIVNISAGS